MMRWNPIKHELPEKRDEYYLFGGWTDDGKWAYSKYHYSLHGLVNGWNQHTLIKNGNTHWAEVPPPEDT